VTEIVSPKKLIEVAMPLEAINTASAREKSVRHGHPSTLHLWWARRPLAAARAVIFAQMVDDPSSNQNIFPTEAEQERERERLFSIIRRLIVWENTTDESLFAEAMEEIKKSWQRTCNLNKNHPDAKSLFNPDDLPEFHDPFAGGGALPLEAQRLGLRSNASDLNPVAVLINKAMIEIPPKFAGRPPVNPESRQHIGHGGSWKGATGLAEDIRYYGEWVRNKAEKQIGHLYQKVEITEDMSKQRPDLRQYIGQKLDVIAWLWAKTVKSPNPAFSNVDVPLTSTFMISTKKGKEAYIEPIVNGSDYQFAVKTGSPLDSDATKAGTSAGKRSAFICLISGSPISYEYIRNEGKSGRMGTRLMAIVAKGKKGRVYLNPTSEQEEIAANVDSSWKPDIPLPHNTRDFKTPLYGLNSFGELFTDRQLLALNTFSDQISEVRDQIQQDISETGLSNDNLPLRKGGSGSLAYAEALSVYLSFGVDRLANRMSINSIWNRVGEKIEQVFARQAIPMTWDFAEANAFSDSTGGWRGSLEWIPKCVEQFPAKFSGTASQIDASSSWSSSPRVISTDPPYYDNIGYADLSDFFYAWLRRSMKTVYPDTFATLAVPKVEELIADSYRHGGKESAEQFFIAGMTKAMSVIARTSHPSLPITIYYAYKQSETKIRGTKRTGWETFLGALIGAGLTVGGTWPVRTERDFGMKSGANVLASSIVLVCRKRPEASSMATRAEFVGTLRRELADRIRVLQSGNISPVDLPQSSIGPGIEIFTRFSKVLEADGSQMAVGAALSLIDQIRDEVLAEQEGEYDSQTRWAISWFEQYGMNYGSFGDADNLARARNTTVDTLAKIGIVESGASKVRLYGTNELDENWNPEDATTVTVWEATHHLLRSMNPQTGGGEEAAGKLASNLGGDLSDRCKDLAYRMHSICESYGRSELAMSYNGLVQAWPGILSSAVSQQGPVQASF
jgi:putative DNA methylase